MIKKFSLTGLNYRTSPIELREKLSVSGEELKNTLQILKSYEEVLEVVGLSTCNRVEYYFFSEIPVWDNFKRFLKTHYKLEDDEIEKHFYYFEGEGAIRHLFIVAGSLDSMVIGEPQILNQVKVAYSDAVSAGTAGKRMSTLFHHSFRVGKRIRNETAIGEVPISISHVAVEMAERIFGSLEDKSAAVMGTGEMGLLTARELISHGIKNISVISRTTSRAEEIIESIGKGLPITYEDFFKGNTKFDVIITATGAPSRIITKNMVQEIITKRKGNPLFIIDISMPRVVEESCNDVDEVFLYYIDDLEKLAQENRTLRMEEAEKGKKIVDEEVNKFIKKLREIDLNKTIGMLYKSVGKIIEEEVEEMLEEISKKGKITPEIKEGFINSLTKKLLHIPSVKIKKIAREGKFIDIYEVFENIFDIKKEN